MHRKAYRVYRMSLPVAVIAALPILVLVGWYAWSAFARFDRYRRVAGSPRLSAETFQIFLHDELSRDLRRFFIDERPADSPLPTFELSLTRESLSALQADSVREGQGSYVKAYVRKDGTMHTGRLRYRGRRHWHWLGAQKSMKVRLDKGDLIDGTRVFNLINDMTPFGLEEEIILDIARERGLLTPEYHPVWVRLNNADMGVYRYEAQPAEGLIRRAGRMPGSIFSGNTSATGPQVGAGELFAGLAHWTKAAWQQEDEKEDFSELERLLSAINDGTHEEFLQFARHELDLEKLAVFDALDVVFGGDQHDFVSNHKYFFDAFRGRFEPIAWNFRAFTHDPEVNFVDNPLLLRLKSLPEYLWQRDRQVYRLALGQASVAEVRKRVDAHFAKLRSDLEADPYWDAYKLLARASRFHRFMVRPMNTGRWLIAAQAELRRYAHRNRFLLDLLEKPNLRVAGAAPGTGPIVIEATVGKHAAHLVREMTLTARCGGNVSLYADIDLDGRLIPGRDPIIASGHLGDPLPFNHHHHLVPGIELARRKGGRFRDGQVRAVRVSRTYRYLAISTGCPPEAGVLDTVSLVTGASSRSYFSVARRPLPPLPAPISANQVPSLGAGEQSPHPWLFAPDPEPHEVVLSGVVRFDTTRVFGTHEHVEIAPGTQILLGAGASLIFLGGVSARGTRRTPIEFRPIDRAEPFGGILILGPRTAGSTLSHLTIVGGSRPTYRAVYTPSLINIYDTADITIEDTHISRARASDDLLHATYVERLKLYDLILVDAPVDAIDIELSRAELRGVQVLGAGDECLDLMGSTVQIADSLLLHCPNNAVSAGEETDLTAHGLVIADAKVGVLAKNASSVRISRSLIYRAEQALRTNRRDVHYDQPSSIDALDVFAVDCDKVRRRAKRTRIHTQDVHEALPANGALTYLSRQVLGLSNWSELDDYLARLDTQGVPRLDTGVSQ